MGAGLRCCRRSAPTGAPPEVEVVPVVQEIPGPERDLHVPRVTSVGLQERPALRLARLEPDRVVVRRPLRIRGSPDSSLSSSSS